MLAEEGPYLAPAIHALLGPVERPVPVEEAVTGAVIAVELVTLAVFLERSLVLVHLLRAWRAVVVAEEADQRTAQVRRHVDRRDRRLLVELLLGHHHAAAPEVRARIDVFFLARIDERMPAARAGAENADLAIEARLAAHPLHGGFGVADHLRVRNSALGPHLGGDVIRIALAGALIEVGTDRQITVMREAPRRLDVELAPARQMMHQHHAREGTLALGLCRV